MLSKSDLQSFQKRLTHLLARLSGDRRQLEEEVFQPSGGESGGGISDTPIHLADLGSHQGEVEVNLLMMENETKLLREIEDALARLAEGTFGKCEKCHHAVAKARLEVLPYCRYCINCEKEVEEKGEE